MTEVRLDKGWPGRLLADHGEYVTIQYAGIIPEVVRADWWKTLPFGRDEEFIKKRDDVESVAELLQHAVAPEDTEGE